MNEKENAYLAKFRELHAARKVIEKMIAELRAICESLKDWQKTAGDIASMGGVGPEWSDGRLNGLLALRAAMVSFHGMKTELVRTWGNMATDEKVGLAEPATVTAPG